MSRNMKDSGVEWIGEVPFEWGVVKIKHPLKERKENNKPRKTNNILSLLKDRGVIPYDEKGDIGNKSKENLEDYKLAYPGDIVLNSMNVIIGSVGLSKYFGAVSPVYYMLNTRYPEDSVQYLNYIFQTEEFQKSLIGYGNGILAHRMRIQMQKLNTAMIPYPKPETQQKIASFLDKKVAEIDHIITKTQASIEEYKRYKQSIITEAVTKGLDPNVPMKGSGIEWIGEIPEHWEVTRLKNLLDSPLKYGANSSGVTYDENLPRYIRITDVTLDNNLKDDGKLSLPIEEAEEFLLTDNDILFARSGATVGKTFLYKEDYGLSAFAGYLIKASASDINEPEFIYYYTLSSAYNEWKNRIFIQATIQNIGANKYSNMEIVIPSNKDEQIEIVKFVQEKTSHIDNLISQKEQLLSDLESYKKSLIYEVVTGKKEVM